MELWLEEWNLAMTKRNNLQKIFGAIAVVLYTIITVVPIVFALDRLILVSGFDPMWVIFR